MPLSKPLAQVKTDLQNISTLKLDEALKSLQGMLPGTASKKKEVLMLQARLEKVGEEARSGGFSDDYVSTANNKIHYDFLGLVEVLKEKDFEETAATATAPVAAVPKFMIVYVEEEESYSAKLNKFLFLLKRGGKMKVYNVHSDAKGRQTFETAETELADTDYILCLVTLNLLTNIEWLDFIFKALDAGKRVIPIRIADISLQDSGLEKFRSLPSQSRTLTGFINEDAAYNDVVTEIRKLLPA